jgi:putative OPT family oligopeptide transporter
MQSGEPKKSKLLPDSAYRELKEGEVYEPVVPADKKIPEVTVKSVLIGLIMVVIFTFAAAYIGLKTGNVIEAAIPIVILAVFIGKLLPKKNTLLENVIIQSIGQASGVIVAGAVFTIPALYINQLEPNLLHIFIACFLGGALGVVLIIPLRKYFVQEEHGKLPFPEATAINQILVSGEETTGSGGKILLTSFGVGAGYDLIVETVHGWNQHLNSKVLLGGVGKWLSELRMEFKLDAAAALFGLGYIIGIKYAAIIAAGSVLSCLVMVPMVFSIGSGLERPLMEGHGLVRDMGAGDIFALYVRPVGIGAIAVAGFIGIIKMGKIILSSLSLAFKGGSKQEAGAKVIRTQWDLKPRTLLAIQGACVLSMALFFFFLSRDIKIALLGTLIAYVLVFLFTPVAARAIAIVGVNPVSGMTLITLIIACVSLAAIGLSEGAVGQSVALLIGCTVCTALSTSGAFISDLKIGYWLGATPREQERWKFLGIALASLSVGVVILILSKSYGFTIINEAGQTIANPNLPAPQGNLMAAIVTALLGGENQPYLLYALGGLIAIMLEMVKVPALAFALGMYLPIQINMAVLAGGLANYIVGRTGGSEKVQQARQGQGTLIASGLLAGAAIMGTIGATMRLDWPLVGSIARFLDIRNFSHAFTEKYYEAFGGQFVSVLMFIGLGVVCYLIARWGATEETKSQVD